MIWALIALGYTLVYGIIELINFAHGDVFMIGASSPLWLMAPRSASEGDSVGAHRRSFLLVLIWSSR